MSGVWKTSVNELVTIFREAMTALLPSIEKAKIAWTEGEAYDDWNEIAKALYRNIVERSLGYALDQELTQQELIPRYNMIYDNYAKIGRVEVNNCDEVGLCVFVGLSSISEPFDTVDYVVIDELGVLKNDEYGHIPLRDASLYFRFKDQMLSDLTIKL